jgi:hypothetical protein
MYGVMKIPVKTLQLPRAIFSQHMDVKDELIRPHHFLASLNGQWTNVPSACTRLPWKTYNLVCEAPCGSCMMVLQLITCNICIKPLVSVDCIWTDTQGPTSTLLQKCVFQILQPFMLICFYGPSLSPKHVCMHTSAQVCMHTHIHIHTHLFSIPPPLLHLHSLLVAVIFSQKVPALLATSQLAPCISLAKVTNGPDAVTDLYMY